MLQLHYGLENLLSAFSGYGEPSLGVSWTRKPSPDSRRLLIPKNNLRSPVTRPVCRWPLAGTGREFPADTADG